MTYTRQNWHQGSHTNASISDIGALRAMDDQISGVQTASVTAFGAVGDNVHDDTAAIQAAVDSLANGGGTILFPTGVFKVTSTITISTGGIILRGASSSVDHFSGSRNGNSTEIQWAGSNGGGPVIDFSPPSGSGAAFQGGGMENISVYCANQGSSPAAAVGIRLRSVWKMVFRDVAVKEASTACWQFTAYSSGFAGGEATIHNCQFYNCSAFCFTQSGIGFQATATSTTGGITLSCFFGCFAYSNSTSPAVDLSACDDLFWFGLNAANNVGAPIALRGKNTSSGWYSSARNIHFHSLFAGHTQSIQAQAGDGSDPSHANVIYGLSFEDGYIAPVVESGASLTYYDTRGMLVVNGGSSAAAYAIDLKSQVPASAISLRLPNDKYIGARNAADSADIAMMKLNTLNEVEISTTSRFGGSSTFGAGLTFTFGAGANIALATTTGTKIGTAGGASGQKLGFFNATPIVQPLLATGAGATVDNVITALQNLGLVRQS